VLFSGGELTSPVVLFSSYPLLTKRKQCAIINRLNKLYIKPMTHEKLLQVKGSLKGLEDQMAVKKAAFEEDTKFLKAQISDLADEENILKAEVMADMVENSQDSITCEDKVIIKSIRTTKKVENTNDFFESLSDEKVMSEIKDFVDIDKVKESIAQEYVIKDKKTVENMFNEYEKLTGKLLPGVVKNETQYLTIKDKV